MHNGPLRSSTMAPSTAEVGAEAEAEVQFQLPEKRRTLPVEAVVVPEEAPQTQAAGAVVRPRGVTPMHQATPEAQDQMLVQVATLQEAILVWLLAAPAELVVVLGAVAAPAAVVAATTLLGLVEQQVPPAMR
jgi:hypothetical protein